MLKSARWQAPSPFRVAAGTFRANRERSKAAVALLTAILDGKVFSGSRTTPGEADFGAFVDATDWYGTRLGIRDPATGLTEGMRKAREKEGGTASRAIETEMRPERMMGVKRKRCKK